MAKEIPVSDEISSYIYDYLRRNKQHENIAELFMQKSNLVSSIRMTNLLYSSLNIIVPSDLNYTWFKELFSEKNSIKQLRQANFGTTQSKGYSNELITTCRFNYG